MESGEKVVDPEIGEQNSDKSDDGQDGRFPSPPIPCQPGMQKGGIDKPGDEGPGLFGIPAPIGSPRIIRPGRPVTIPRVSIGNPITIDL